MNYKIKSTDVNLISFMKALLETKEEPTHHNLFTHSIKDKEFRFYFEQRTPLLLERHGLIESVINTKIDKDYKKTKYYTYKITKKGIYSLSLKLFASKSLAYRRLYYLKKKYKGN